MNFFFASLTIDLLIICITISGVFYVYVSHVFRYWRKREVTYIKPIFPWGLMKEQVMLKKALSQIYSETYFKMRNEKYVGFFSFWSPGIIINDLDIIKNVMVRDFNYFQDRGIYCNKEVDPLSMHLFSMEGSEWKQMRNKLTPTFTSGKMKMMFDIVVKCGEDLRHHVTKAVNNSKPIEWKDVFGRYGCTVIAQSAFGLETNSFENTSSKFYDMISQVTEPSLVQMFRFVLSFFAKSLAKLLNIRIIPKEVSDFYMGVVKETVSYRETNNFTRNDFMQLLIQLKKKGSLQDAQESYKGPDMGLTMNQITAQAFVFVLAGFETTSSTMSFCIYELAMNPNIQKTLQEEVDKLEGELTYENIYQMQYLDMVVNETLRKYPALGFINRQCTQNYKVPDSDLVLEKGTTVIIPVFGLHHNPEYFPQPETFLPERFSEENVKNIKPYSYLPFGEGPRVCIGMRFAKMQIKVGLVMLLKEFEFQVNSKTPMSIVFSPLTLTSTSKGGMWISAVKRHA